MNRTLFITAFAIALPAVCALAADPFAEGVRPTDPLPAAEQQKKFNLPPGFEIQLVAQEPDINKPMNMAFDALGRLWVTTSIEYPWAAPTNRPGRDRLMIFEDFGPDGRARKVTEFAGGLNIPIGIYPFRSPRSSRGNEAHSSRSEPSQSLLTSAATNETWKCIVWSIPNIWLMEDTDGDGKADKREVLYGPFDHTRDTHGNQASFRRGFDGWLYATHGFNNDSHVKGRDGNEVHLNSGNTYRMRLDGSRIEHHTHGQVNPYGLAWDPSGNLYSSDCHSAPIYQLLAGGYYPSFGKPHDGLGFAPTMMEHAHGSTAIDGIVYYADDLWPEEFRDNIFIGNVMTSLVNRDRITLNGSTPKANELDDFVKCDDPWFRPVDNQLGPDGAFYIADFYNRIIGHYEVPLTHPGRDRERGRIWRVVYKGGNPQSEIRNPKLPENLDGLIAELGSPNLTRRMLAMNEISDRFGRSAIKPLQEAVGKLTGTSSAKDATSPAYLHVQALWLLHRLDGLGEGLVRYAASRANSLLRVHAMRILADRGLLGRSSSPKPGASGNSNTATDREAAAGRMPALRKQLVAALNDSDLLVQRCAAEALGAWPAFDNIRPLLDLKGRVSAADTHLLYVVRKAIRDHLNHDDIFREVLSKNWSDTDLAALADVAVAVKSPLAGTFLLRQLERTKVDRETATTWLRHAARYAPVEAMDKLAAFARKQIPEGFGAELYAELDRQFALFKSVDEGLQQRGVAMPPAIRDWGSELARRFFHSLDGYHSWTYTPYESNPTANPWGVEKRRCADGQTRELTSSFPHGEQLTGVLRSPPFEAPERLSFWLCGHNGLPAQSDHRKNGVRLLLVTDRGLPGRSASATSDASSRSKAPGSSDAAAGGTPAVRDGEFVAEAFPPRNDTAQRINWDLSGVRGKKVFVEVVDGDTAGAYAWIAFGGFEPQLSQLRPSEFAPRKMTDWLTAATDIAARLQLKEYAPIFARSILPRPGFDLTGADPDVLAAFARGWAALAPDEAIKGLSATLTAASYPPLFHERLGIILSEMNSSVAHATVASAMKMAPARVQNRWGQALAGTPGGAEALLAAVESARLSPRLLQTASVRDRIKAAKPANWEARLNKLTRDLPPASDKIDKLIAERRNNYHAASARSADGKVVYEQNCAVCHRIDGQGGLVGPQLDGIGNRGLERLLEDTLDPNRNVDHAFRSHTLTLKDGDIISGLPRREEGELLILADSTGKELSVSKKDIQERRESETSLMPENFGEIIAAENFNNLMAFLLSQRGSPGNSP
ncbi:MAG TPA: c-type cytochrome [Verrucomicrobiae bacterium]|nr:c-type cytochrome [Verrucomicrobiae bacterium]